MHNMNGLETALRDVEVVATDVDDTLTIDGELTSGVVRAIEHINRTGKRIILVTGRSGGACTTLSQYLPVEMVIAENGGVIIRAHDISTIALPADHRARLDGCIGEITGMFPGIRPAQDNPFRLTDLSMDNRSIPGHARGKIEAIARAYGLSITVSSVQTHLLCPGCNKADTLKAMVGNRKTVTIGDSVNDESLFNPALFPLSVGVANIGPYLPALKYRPRWITSKEQGHGFIEFAELFHESSLS